MVRGDMLRLGFTACKASQRIRMAPVVHVERTLAAAPSTGSFGTPSASGS
jgi:hypothetical protein